MGKTLRGPAKHFASKRQKHHRTRAGWCRRNSVRLRTLHEEIRFAPQDNDLTPWPAVLEREPLAVGDELDVRFSDDPAEPLTRVRIVAWVAHPEHPERGLIPRVELAA